MDSTTGEYALDKFYRRVSEAPKQPESNKVEYSVLNNASINSDLFKRTIRNMDSMDNSNLYAFIQANIDQIVSDIINNDKDYGIFITNHRFLDVFISIISKIPITYNIKLCCNKLVYDYSTLSENVDNTIKTKLISLSNIVNRDVIKRLMDLGLTLNDSCNIAISRYSTANERINTERLNFVLCNMSSKYITLQNTIYIYEILYDKITPLFSGNMFETYTEEEEDEFGNEFTNNYSTISLALLTIVNNLTSSEIETLLSGFIEEWTMKKCPQTRFSFRSLSNDYPMINNVVERMIHNSVYIP